MPKPEEIKGDLILDGVNFFTGSADLTPASLEILRKVAESLLAWPDVAIEIRGHTDDAGPAETNRDLSQRRALAVRDYLIRYGISATASPPSATARTTRSPTTAPPAAAPQTAAWKCTAWRNSDSARELTARASALKVEAPDSPRSQS